jgi:hypothetical protein
MQVQAKGAEAMTPSQCRRMKMLLHDHYGDYKQLLNKTHSPRTVDEFDRCVIHGSLTSLRVLVEACEAIMNEMEEQQ